MPLLRQWVRSFPSWQRMVPGGSSLGLTYPPARCCGSCMSHHCMACSSKSVNNAVEQCCKGRHCMAKQQLEVSDHNAHLLHVIQTCMSHSSYACTMCASCLAISNRVCTSWPRGSFLKGALNMQPTCNLHGRVTDDINLHQAGRSQSRQNVLWHAGHLNTPVALLVFKSTSPIEPKPPSPERAGVGSVPSTLLMTAMPDPSTASKEGMPPV